MGAEQGLIGLYISQSAMKMGLSAREIGQLFACHSFGSALIISAALNSKLEKFNRYRVSIACSAFSIGAAILVLIDVWLVKGIAMLLLGAGFGGLSMAFNTLFVARFSKRNTGVLNALNATYGIGAVLSPWLLFSDFLSIESILLLISFICAILLIPGTQIDDRVPEKNLGEKSCYPKKNLPILLVIIFLSLFMESSITYWAPGLLSISGMTVEEIANFMARFFVWFVSIRIAAIFIAGYFNSFFLGLMGVIGIAVVFSLLALEVTTLGKVSFVGACVGLMFPNIYAWVLISSRGGTKLGAKALLTGLAGSIAGPWIIGVMIPILGAIGAFGILSSTAGIAVIAMCCAEIGIRKRRTL